MNTVEEIDEALERASGIAAQSDRMAVADKPKDGIYIIQLANEVKRLRDETVRLRDENNRWFSEAGSQSRVVQRCIAKLERVEALPARWRETYRQLRLIDGWTYGLTEAAKDLEAALRGEK